MAAITYTARRGVSLIGDELGCWMADTTAETVGVDETTRLETNGDFDSDISGWTDNSSAGGTIQWNASGYLELVNTTARPKASQAIITEVGQNYLVTIDKVDSVGNLICHVGTINDGNDLRNVGLGSAAGTYSVIVKAASTTTYFQVTNGATGTTTQITSIKVQKTGNLVENNGFTDFTVKSWTEGTGWTISAGVASNSGSSGSLSIPISVVVGNRYVIQVNIKSTTSGLIQLNKTDGVFNISTNPDWSTVGIHTITLMAMQTGDLSIYSDAFNGSIDDISVRLADPDITSNNNGSEVYGQITKAAVATGAGLVGYSGFSEDDNLRVTENPLASIGTGDFSIIGWMTRGNAACLLASAGVKFASGFGFWHRESDNKLIFTIGTAGSLLSGNTNWSDGEYHHVAAVRSNGVAYIYADGVLIASVAMAHSASYTGTLYIGGGGYQTAKGHSIASLRIYDYGLTAAQIRMAYKSEKHLFEPYSHYTQEGVQYSFDIDLASRGMPRMSDRHENKPIEGPSEVMLFSDWREWNVTTTLRSRADMAEVAEFLTSALDGRTITFDPYGTIATPDTPLICQVDQDSFSESETTLGWRQISFKVRET